MSGEQIIGALLILTFAVNCLHGLYNDYKEKEVELKRAIVYGIGTILVTILCVAVIIL